MKESPFIEQILVVGEGRKHPAALIVPAFNEMANHLSPRRYSSRRELIADPKVQALIQQEVDRLNQNFGRYLQVKKFLLVADDWTVDTGELTATLKLKRRCVTEKYANEIESLYAESAPVKVAGGW
ncbi:MAG: hypothetical protein JO170_33255 [Verrucomicrobia bacterium]|nr:hypothetical protein [Verrucomicrobiota bacterium]